MRWTNRGRSENLEDRRGQAGGGMRLPLPGGRMGIGLVLVLLVASVIFKRNFFALLGGDAGPAPGQEGSQPYQSNPEEEELVNFVSFVLDDAQEVWAGKFAEMGRPYRAARLVLFTDGVQSGCGSASAGMGPFYCPADEKVYIDLGFYRELRSRFGAPGDFAQAYVLAHEIGHHVQHLLGIDESVRERQAASSASANELQIAMELQADCLAGAWAHSTERRQLLEENDVEEAMNAAAAVGDDRIQKQASGRVNPESWTHGSSRQRMTWFVKGLRSGDPSVCDAFASLAR
jgi:predicted metalloprotease